MKEITILSGKGGAGKTTITAALASVASNSIFCDNDVDAADLHLILKPKIKEQYTFNSGNIAVINQQACTLCGKCHELCRFDAIHFNTGGQMEVNPFQCEGCRLCERICPEKAITSENQMNNFWYVSNTRFGTLLHARMSPGEENSGKLVTKIRQKAAELAQEINADFIINDGPPGIGCTAISAVTGSDMVVVVLEPTLPGLHDAKRLIELVQSFNIPLAAIINKADLNQKITQEVENFLDTLQIPLIGKLPFSIEIVESIVSEKTITEYAPESTISKEIHYIWNEIQEYVTI